MSADGRHFSENIMPGDGGDTSGSTRPADGRHSGGNTRSADKRLYAGNIRSADGRDVSGNEEENRTMHCACMEAEQYLAAHGIADAAVDAWYLLEYVTGVSRAKYLADRNKRLSREQWDAYAALIEKRGAHIPLQYLTGEQEFMGLPFLVNEDVLIPRQDTELLVETALTILKTEIPAKMTRKTEISAKMNQKTEIPAKAFLGMETLAETPQRLPYRVLDLCTGSGCIAISIEKLFEQWQSRTQCIETQCSKTDGESGKSSREKIAGGSVKRFDGGTTESRQLKSGENAAAKAVLEIYASDISEAALTVARENAGRLGADVHFVQSDLFENIAGKLWQEQSVDTSSSLRDNIKDSTEDHARIDDVAARFDMIVSNPPYIRTSVIEELDEEVRLHQPHLALAAVEEGLGILRR
ncbi:MAG: peptide chain release factor N(5)-glutamine methyltransferase, partial [Lachnospiraceae bacterium]|nr:peptide chain release factor N(5)-glutamine methyltransferase [Lachnospiraceae bacterium]